MQIENDNGLSALIRSAEATKLCGGFGFTEGPIWVAQDACLLFSDIPGDRIHRWRPGADNTEVYREPSRNANGLTLDAAGNLLACEHSGRQVTRAAYGQPEEVVVDSFEGQRLNSPNDIVVHSGGALYFTDPSYGLPPDLSGKELDFQGVYRVDPDGSIACVERGFSAPNGLAFTPDESHLYIGDSKDHILTRYRVEPDGSLTDRELFLDARHDTGRGAFDGMKVDEDGRLWTTGPGGVWVAAPDGALLGILIFPEQPANICFGGPDFSTIYVTARTSVYSADTRVRGIAPGSR
jgi:sugar lactone lactonase YvrE